MTVSTKALLDLADEHRGRSAEDWPRPAGADPATGTVAIVGKGFDHSIVPWGTEGYEFWGLNDQPGNRPEYAPIECYTRWFQLHPPHYLEVHYPRGIKDLKRWWGTPRGVKLYMDRHYDWLPDSVPYPKAEVEALCSYGHYHCSSFDWMVALAILEGWSRIEMYGVDFFTFPSILNGEPISARACLEFWLGVAAGRGIDVAVSQRGDLFTNIHVAIYRSDLQYGFEREPALDLTLDDERWSDVR